MAPASGAAPIRYAPGWSSEAISAAMARSRRRSRFRSTAPPTRRPTANPIRGGSGETPAVKVTDTGPLRTRRPRSRRSAKVDRSRIRQIRPRDERGPCAAAPAGWPGRPASTCGGETRGSSRACACWAGTCASHRPPGGAQRTGCTAPRPTGGRVLAGPVLFPRDLFRPGGPGATVPRLVLIACCASGLVLPPSP